MHDPGRFAPIYLSTGSGSEGPATYRIQADSGLTGQGKSFVIFDEIAQRYRLVINGNGHVGIGDLPPLGPLHVHSWEPFTPLFLSTGVGSEGQAIFRLQADVGLAGQGRSFGIYDDMAGQYRMLINGIGHVAFGTPNQQPLEIRVNGQRILRLQPNETSPNVIGGHPGNVVSNGKSGAFIGGGGNSDFPNRVEADYATVVGGYGNTASGLNSTAMGALTSASGAVATAIGSQTQASGSASTAMGRLTKATGPASTGLGWLTTASGDASTAMGELTEATAFAATAMGWATRAGGVASAAMGYRAKANHDGCFVWADLSDWEDTAGFTSTTSNQFSIRARGGVRFENQTSLHFGNGNRQMLNLFDLDFGIGVQDSAQYFRTGDSFYWYMGGSHQDPTGDAGGGQTLMSLYGSGVLTVSGSVEAPAFNQSSDRHAKTEFETVNPQDVLDQVAALPISRWVFKTDPATQHLGPMAQDFHAAFGLGPDDKHIATVDADGVALAAIQGLNLKLEEQLRKKDAQIAELLRRVEELEQKLAPSETT
jgi:hypothetical protein